MRFSCSAHYGKGCSECLIDGLSVKIFFKRKLIRAPERTENETLKFLRQHKQISS